MVRLGGGLLGAVVATSLDRAVVKECSARGCATIEQLLDQSVSSGRRCPDRHGRDPLVIRFDSVSKRYPDGTVAVDSLDMTAPSRQITVLVGPSGCGKTTSLRMVNRMITPTEGRIWLDDQDTGTLKPHELRRQMGYVIQHAGLFPHRTIVDNIATVPYLLGWDKKKAQARARELLE